MKKNKLPSLIAILILTLITTVVWIGLSIYRALVAKPPQSVPQEISQPITPTLDTDTLGKLGTKVFLDSSQIPDVTVSATSQPIPTQKPIVSPIASPSAIPEPSPATGAGTP